jgi:hypothetical protein
MVTLSGAATDLFVARSLLFCFLAWAAWFSICPVSASAQVGSQQIGAQQIGVQESPATNSVSQSETKQNSAEIFARTIFRSSTRASRK